MTILIPAGPPAAPAEPRTATGRPTALTDQDVDRIAAAISAACTESTQRVYAYTWGQWARWCAARGLTPLPGDPAALCAYLTERAADGIAISSLDLACTAIRHVHRVHSAADPVESQTVRQVRLGLRRTFGTAPRRLARPLSTADIRQILTGIDRAHPIGVRDAAIILLGYASALPRSELTALTLLHVEDRPDGLLISIRRSKTDQEGHGHTIGVARGKHLHTEGSPFVRGTAGVGLLTTSPPQRMLLIMLDAPSRDRAAERREATRREIVEAAWALAQEKGLAEFTLRDVAERVGMRAPSLYTHFESKHAIYDAMFGQGWSDGEQLALTEFADLPQPPRAALRRAARVFFDFAVDNPARHQLLNQRTIPGFEPSPESYAPAVRVLEMGRQLFRDLGLGGLIEAGDYDIWVAMIDGLINQQLANDPGGTRWSALLDRAIDVWADGVGIPLDPPTQRRRATQPQASRRRTRATRSTS